MKRERERERTDNELCSCVFQARADEALAVLKFIYSCVCVYI